MRTDKPLLDLEADPLAVPAASPQRLLEIRGLEESLGHTFSDPALLVLALTHSSATNRPSRGFSDYEGLEFLGDSILGFLISEFLFRKHPGLSAGELSKMKGFLVSRHQLSRLSAELGLGAYLVLGRGEEKTGGRTKRAILADVFESVVAALYLDGGLEAAGRFVLDRFEPLLTKLGQREIEFRDYKSKLQELLHARGLRGPVYRVAAEEGPDHRKEFHVEVVIEGRTAAAGRGKSKKEAEQRAASAAFESLGDR